MLATRHRRWLLSLSIVLFVVLTSWARSDSGSRSFTAATVFVRQDQFMDSIRQGHAGGTDRLAWSSWPQAVRLILIGRTHRPALTVALVVGTLLSAINQGAVIWSGDASFVTLVRIVANYAIPYAVSSVGLLSAHRR